MLDGDGALDLVFEFLKTIFSIFISIFKETFSILSQSFKEMGKMRK